MLAQLLIVEDDPHLGPLLRDYLSADYQAFHASTIKEAQAWLGTHSSTTADQEHRTLIIALAVLDESLGRVPRHLHPEAIKS